MASLAECEGLRGKVQCIYIDPPYGPCLPIYPRTICWVTACRRSGVTPQVVRPVPDPTRELDRGRVAAENAELSVKILDENASTASGRMSVGTMHLAKGLKFRAVAVTACDEVIPLQARIETVADDTDLEEVYNTERHLFYVACTRARDRLLVSGVGPASEFLDGMRM